MLVRPQGCYGGDECIFRDIQWQGLRSEEAEHRRLPLGCITDRRVRELLVVCLQCEGMAIIDVL